jgi:hypothetical protein
VSPPSAHHRSSDTRATAGLGAVDCALRPPWSDTCRVEIFVRGGHTIDLALRDEDRGFTNALDEAWARLSLVAQHRAHDGRELASTQEER